MHRPIEIVDVGASTIDGPAPYERLLHTGRARLTGFDYGLALPARSVHAAYWPFLIADGAGHTYYSYAAPGLNSLLRIDPDAAKSFPEARKWMEARGSTNVLTHTLDGLAFVPPIDWLKMDCQGSELAVLRNGRAKLSRCVVVQIELPFCLLYHDQPTLGQLDNELQYQGFVPRDICSVRRASTGQIIDLDALYTRADSDCDETQRSMKEEILTACYARSA